jgi:regulator of nonsense transcripts 2
VVGRTAPVRVPCPEDEEFLAALDRMVNENISEAKAMQRDKAGLAQLTAPVTSGRTKKTWEQIQVRKRCM